MSSGFGLHGLALKAACVPGKEDSKPSGGVYILIFGFVR